MGGAHRTGEAAAVTCARCGAEPKDDDLRGWQMSLFRFVTPGFRIPSADERDGELCPACAARAGD
jgi:hypothetical protein